MIVRDIQDIVERWAPKQVAWERDNVGLQIGDPHATVKGILVTLDVTGDIVKEAVEKKVNLVISHHPLLFKPLQSVRTTSGTAAVLREMILHQMNLFTAHTNLDFTFGGTSFALATSLNLQKLDFLRKAYQVQEKIITFVTAEHVDRVASAMASAGAGVIGNYENCSFRTEGTGTFRGNSKSNPAVGTKNQLESSREVRLEMIVDSWNAEQVVSAMKAAHPYEEVAYDRYPLVNYHGRYGEGVIGELGNPLPLSQFLEEIKNCLKTKTLRYTGEPKKRISRVAVCGGSGSELLEEAMAQGADAFVTADIRYHAFHEAAGKIALIDAGHYETEEPVVHTIVKKLSEALGTNAGHLRIEAAETLTNPVRYYS
ncbi:MAG TPA: Nif3-like dinuclear metal center hexameric protein [Bacteroidota bacterium]